MEDITKKHEGGKVGFGVVPEGEDPDKVWLKGGVADNALLWQVRDLHARENNIEDDSRLASAWPQHFDRIEKMGIKDPRTGLRDPAQEGREELKRERRDEEGDAETEKNPKRRREEDEV